VSFQVTINPAQIRFTVQQGETILAAALRAGIDFPNRCRQGICTSCVCKLQSGQVHYQAPQPLSEQDKQQFAYCCLAYADTDLVLHHPFIRG
jgi:ferredoxin